MISLRVHSRRLSALSFAIVENSNECSDDAEQTRHTDHGQSREEECQSARVRIWQMVVSLHRRSKHSASRFIRRSTHSGNTEIHPADRSVRRSMYRSHLSLSAQSGSALDAKKNQIRPLSDLTFLAACDSPSSGRSVPSKRLLQSFSIFALADPAAKQLFHIYSVRLGRFLNSLEFSVDVRSSLYLLVSACLVMYYRVSINILPTPSKVHYIFNLRDLAKLAQGIMQASPMNTTNQERVSPSYESRARDDASRFS